MPHAIIEYTDNLAQDGDIKTLLKKIAAKLRDSDGVFPIGGIRVRAIRLTDYVIADEQDDYAFVHTTLKIGAGRPETFRKAFFGGLFELIKDHFAEIAKHRPLALSMYVDEVDETGSYKFNTIHDRMRERSARSAVVDA